MKFVFWNVQRLGSATPQARGEIMEAVLADAFEFHGAEYAILCEVSGSASLGVANVNKQVQVFRRGANARAAQLGYACIDAELNEVVLEQFKMPTFTDVFGNPTHRKGGNDFTRQSKRFVAHAGTYDGDVELYVYHANASAKGAFLVAWVAEALRLEDNGNFLLVGDLNSEPGAVRTQMQLLGTDPDEFEFGEDGPTHNAKTGLNKTYDYAIGGMGIVPVVTRLDITGTIAHFTDDPNANMSDHLPIVVEI
jgi:hypothetical protein